MTPQEHYEQSERLAGFTRDATTAHVHMVPATDHDGVFIPSSTTEPGRPA